MAHEQPQRRRSADRRSRYRYDPSVQMSITLPYTLKEQLEDGAVARRSTLSGIVREALTEWFTRHADEIGGPGEQIGAAPRVGEHERDRWE
jgi:hypothetical protein